ncbi:penicillin-binding transpeptidase domain-containing protein [Oerskovia sp. M15]
MRRGVGQAGSTFKPFTLIAALEKGIDLTEKYDGNNDVQVDGFYDGDRKVVNFDDGKFGQTDLIEATAKSVNTVYAALNMEVGPQATMDVAVKAGIPADTQDLAAVPSNVLGTASVHPLDIAHAYATFAAQGFESTPHVVQSVTRLGSGRRSTRSRPERAGHRTRRDGRCDLRHDAGRGDEGRFRRGSAGARASGRRQVGHLERQQVGVVRRVCPSAHDGRRALPGQRRDQDAGADHDIRRVGSQAEAAGDHRWHLACPGVDLLHAGRHGAAPVRRGAGLPQVHPEEAGAHRDPDGGAQRPADDRGAGGAGGAAQPETVTVPTDLAGRSKAEVKQLLSQLGLKASFTEESSDSVAKDVVIRVGGAGQAVEKGKTVTVVVSKGPRSSRRNLPRRRTCSSTYRAAWSA